VTAYQKEDGGFMDARITDGKTIFSTIKDANSRKSHGGRVALRVVPTSDLTLTGTYIDYKSNGGTRSRGMNPQTGSFSFPEFTNDKLSAVNLTAEYSLG